MQSQRNYGTPRVGAGETLAQQGGRVKCTFLVAADGGTSGSLACFPVQYGGEFGFRLVELPQALLAVHLDGQCHGGSQQEAFGRCFRDKLIVG